MSTSIIDIKYKGNLVSYRVRNGTYDEEVAGAILREYERAFKLDINGLPIIDFGGHIGGFSKIASITYPNSNVHSFEPDPETFSILEENICGIPNCFIHNLAISGNETKGTLIRRKLPTFEPALGERFEPALSTVIWDNSIEGIVVDCLPINSFLDQFDSIGLLKMDCEGSELSFLNHLSNQNKEKIMFIIGEAHPDVKDRYGFKSHHNDGNIMRKFFPRFKMVVEGKMFFGWSGNFSFDKE